MQFDLFDPVFNVHECLTLVYRVGKDYSHGTSIVGLGNCFEFLLPSCVPYLKSNFFFTDKNRFGFEVDADSGEMRSHEVIIAEPEKYVSFSHPTVADD